MTHITARHLSGTRKAFSDPDDIIRFMRKEPNPEMWTIDIDGFKCTGDEVVKARSSGYQTKTLTPRQDGKSYKSLLSEVKALQSDIHDRQNKLNSMLPKEEPVSRTDQGKNFEVIYSLTQNS